MAVIHKAHKCPKCGEDMAPALNLAGGFSPWFSECTNTRCNTIMNTDFSPTNYQLDFILDEKINIGYFGGYGAGKTTSGGFKILMNALSTPGGETLLGAESWAQMFKTNVKELDTIIPKSLVVPGTLKRSLNPKAGTWQLTLRNGHQIYSKVFKREGDLRSLNLTSYWIEEASEVKYGIFNQLNTRLRHDAGKTYLRDENDELLIESFVDNEGKFKSRYKEGKPRYLGLITSNPDPGWIRTKFLYQTPAESIHYYGDDKRIQSELLANVEKNPFNACYIVPTDANYYLPQDFIARNTIGKTSDWIKRYIKGSFSFAEGMVYPSWSKHEVEPFDIPAHWRHIASADFGRRDPMAYLLGAVDPESGILYIYREYYKPFGNTAEWIQGWHDLVKGVNSTSWLSPPIGDPAGQSKGQADELSWFESFANHGIYFVPSRTGKGSEMGIAAGLSLVNEYFEAGKLKFFNTLNNFKMEISDYKYDTGSMMESDDDKVKTEKPKGGKDHLMDTLRGMISVLPRDPQKNMADIQPIYVMPQEQVTAYYTTDEANDPNSKAFWSTNQSDDEDYYIDQNAGYFEDAFDIEGDEYEF